MKTSLKLNLIIFIGGIIAILSVASPFFIYPSNNESVNWSRSQVTLSAIGFIAVFYAFYSTTIQLRKSMAKPRIKVAFNEKGEQQANLTYINNNPCGLPPLWIINEGNAISRFFQIDIIILNNIVNLDGKNLLLYIPHISLEEFDNDYILSYKNEGKYTLFIHKPYNDTDFILDFGLDYKKCIESYKKDFILKYNIYGDWGEPQEGELRLIIDKQKEVPHAIS